MKRKSGNLFRYPGLYRNDLLKECLKHSPFNTPYAVAKELGLNIDTTYRVFNGTASDKHVEPVSDFFGVDWALLHDRTRSLNEIIEIHRAGLGWGTEFRAVDSGLKCGGFGPL